MLKRATLTLCLLLWCASLASGAQNCRQVLYQTQGDTDGDGKAEIIAIYAAKPDPADPGTKALRITKARNATVVFEVYFQGGFKTQFNPLAEVLRNGYTTGVYLHKAAKGKYPEIWVVLTPNSSDMLVFQYDGKHYKRIQVKD